MSEKCWTTQNGETIKIRNMKTKHIKNCIKAIERGDIIGIDLEEYIYEFEEELEFREYIKKIVKGELDN